MPKGLIKRLLRPDAASTPLPQRAATLAGIADLDFSLSTKTDIDIRGLRRRIEALYIPDYPPDKMVEEVGGGEFCVRRGAQCLQCCSTL